MTALRCGVLALAFSVVVPGVAHADDILLDGEVSCLSIGGDWSGGTCTVKKLLVPAGTRFDARFVGLSARKVIIDGTLQILGGSFTVTHSLINRGSLITYSFVVITGPMHNQGTWENGSQFSSADTVVNSWDFYNRGSFESALFVNKGGVLNYTGWIRNSGGSLVNEGFILNAGYLDNPVGAVLDNRGAIENYDGTTFNAGAALGRCGSAWHFQSFGPFPGLPVGNPIEFEPCVPTQQVTALGFDVFELGRHRVISRPDAMVLSVHLLIARELLKYGREQEAVAWLNRFNAEVNARLSGSGWYGLGRSLILRANRAVELIEPD